MDDVFAATAGGAVVITLSSITIALSGSGDSSYMSKIINMWATADTIPKKCRKSSLLNNSTT